MVLIAFRHGLRAAELIDLRWEQVDLENALLHVRRLKNGSPASHPLTGRELRALRRLQREQSKSPFVFISERGTPFTKRSLFRRACRRAEWKRPLVRASAVPRRSALRRSARPAWSPAPHARVPHLKRRVPSRASPPPPQSGPRQAPERVRALMSLGYGAGRSGQT
jgi:hypothetical protein